MIVALAAGAVLALSGVGYVGYKYHSAKSVLAAVKAELTKIEGEAKGELQAVSASALPELEKAKPAILKAVARLKALL